MFELDALRTPPHVSLLQRMSGNMTPPKIKAREVFAIPELFDQIFVNLNQTDIIRGTRVCKDFKYRIEQSPRLRNEISFAPTSLQAQTALNQSTLWTMNPLLSQLFNTFAATSVILLTANGAWATRGDMLRSYARQAQETDGSSLTPAGHYVFLRLHRYDLTKPAARPYIHVKRTKLLDGLYLGQAVEVSLGVNTDAWPMAMATERGSPELLIPTVKVELAAGATFGELLDAIEELVEPEEWQVLSRSIRRRDLS
ncbi:hypothetical protein LTR36_004821 [Oleoguttula mirabilis]|uniref:F-box domain-containing protein n=1 Tax=Oleoguttula mirabilis TaxID=1507867 RepID=A0AAV9JFI6_9PEZI|nr:hypothetical protein LTR36_004821 [Oleoguttula mirabilis]